MPAPGDVHINSGLSTISLAQTQDMNQFVADKVFPNIPVSKQSDLYYIYDSADWNRDEMQKRAPATESKGGKYTLSQDSYFAHVWAFHTDIDDQTRANSDDGIDLERDATAYVTLKAMIRREKAWAQRYFATGVWGTEVAGAGSVGASQVVYWNDASSDPIGDVRRAVRLQTQLTGVRPNTMVLSGNVLDALLDHPDIIDRIKYGQTPGRPANISQSDLEALFKIPRILVMEAIENIAAEGAAMNNQFIGGKHALLTYAAPNPGRMTPSAGYTFSWTGYMGATSNGARIKKFRMEKIASDRVEIEMAFDQKITAASLGYFFKDVIQ